MTKLNGDTINYGDMVHKMKNAELYTYLIRILLISLYSLSPLWAQPDTQVSTDKLYVPNGTATQKVLGGVSG